VAQVRLGETAAGRCDEGASVTSWLAAGGGVLKGEDPLYISSLTAILNLAASMLGMLHEKLDRSGGVGGEEGGEQLARVSRAVLMQVPPIILQGVYNDTHVRN